MVETVLPSLRAASTVGRSPSERDSGEAGETGVAGRPAFNAERRAPM